MDWRIAMGMFIAFLMLSIETYLATYTLGAFRLSHAKLGPTEISHSARGRQSRAVGASRGARLGHAVPASISAG